MITKTKWERDGWSTWEVECDECGEIEEIEGEFEDCISFMRENGWKTTKENGEWVNHCPECQKGLHHKPQEPRGQGDEG